MLFALQRELFCTSCPEESTRYKQYEKINLYPIRHLHQMLSLILSFSLSQEKKNLLLRYQNPFKPRCARERKKHGTNGIRAERKNENVSMEKTLRCCCQPTRNPGAAKFDWIIILFRGNKVFFLSLLGKMKRSLLPHAQDKKKRKNLDCLGRFDNCKNGHPG